MSCVSNLFIFHFNFLVNLISKMLASYLFVLCQENSFFFLSLTDRYLLVISIFLLLFRKKKKDLIK